MGTRSGAERWLPDLLGDAVSFRPRAIALIRAAAWTGLWAAVLAGLFAAADRPLLAAFFGVAAVASLCVLPRLRRTGDAPAAAAWLARIVLLSSVIGAASSGGLASPLGFAAVLAASTSAAFGNPHGVVSCLAAPVVLHVLDLLGVTAAPLGPTLGGAANLATLALVAGATAEYLLGERSSRAAVKVQAARSGSMVYEVAERDLGWRAALLEALPVGLVVVDRSGRLDEVRSQRADAIPGAVPGAEWLAVLTAVAPPADLRHTREALAAWRDGAPLTTVVDRFPTRVEVDGAPVTLHHAALGARTGYDERLVVVFDPGPAEPAGSLDLAHVLAVEVAAARRSGRAIDHRGGRGWRVPEVAAERLGDALRPLVENAVEHAVRHVELRAEVREQGAVIMVTDDGPGIDWSAIRDRAAQAGWPCGGRLELEQALRRPGVSTRGRRGLGLARAEAAAHALGGRLVIADSVEGAGTALELVLPWPLPARPRASADAERPAPRGASRGSAVD